MIFDTSFVERASELTHFIYGVYTHPYVPDATNLPPVYPSFIAGFAASSVAGSTGSVVGFAASSVAGSTGSVAGFAASSTAAGGVTAVDEV